MKSLARIFLIFIVVTSLFISIYAIATVVGLRSEIDDYRKATKRYEQMYEDSVAIASSQKTIVNDLNRHNSELEVIIKSELESKFGIKNSELTDIALTAEGFSQDELESGELINKVFENSVEELSQWNKYVSPENEIGFIIPPDATTEILNNGDYLITLSNGNIVISSRKKVDEVCADTNCINILNYIDWYHFTLFPQENISRYEELLDSLNSNEIYFRVDYKTDDGSTYVIDGYYQDYGTRENIRSILRSMDFSPQDTEDKE